MSYQKITEALRLWPVRWWPHRKIARRTKTQKRYAEKIGNDHKGQWHYSQIVAAAKMGRRSLNDIGWDVSQIQQAITTTVQDQSSMFFRWRILVFISKASQAIRFIFVLIFCISDRLILKKLPHVYTLFTWHIKTKAIRIRRIMSHRRSDLGQL